MAAEVAFTPQRADEVSDPRWFAHDYDARRREIVLRYADRDYWAERRFLDSRHVGATLPTRRLAADRVAGTKASLNFIWHTAFCCSTLIADLIATTGTNLSLREPQILSTFSRRPRQGHALNEPDLAAALALLARRFGGETHVTVKANNAACNLIAACARASTGRALLLYSDLSSFLLSIAADAAKRGRFAQSMFTALARDGDLPPPLRPDAVLSDFQAAALVWHLQIAAFRRAAQTLEAGRATSLDADDFLADPHAGLTAIATFFDLGFDEDDIRAAVTGPLMNRHAKVRRRTFGPTQRLEQLARGRAQFGSEIDDAAAWSAAFFPTTPLDRPVPFPLLTKVHRP